jgi:2,3-bisphosphoglycerate-independent phosphoglycerate mutase
MVEALKKNIEWKGRRGPLVLCIMDGVGYAKYTDGDAVSGALTKALGKLRSTCPATKLKASGKAVGLASDDDMGNSEVGHNAMGCGRVIEQGAALVQQALDSGSIFEGEAWLKLVSTVKKSGGTLHFLGLFSDGNVHSRLDHVRAMIARAKKEGIKKVRVHILWDGRDVEPTSALDYLEPFETFLKELNGEGFDARVASGGGRMWITMDRYGADWEMVQRGWAVHVHGTGRQFASAKDAVLSYRKELPGIIDQDLKEFVIAENGKPVGTVEDGDSVVYFNFRGDRALEITQAFEQENFDKFDRGRRPEVFYAGMMEYDSDLHIPKNYLVNPPQIDRTLGEYLAKSGVRTLAISETQKYGHVTYFFNGNKLGKFDEKLENYVEIPSDVVPFEQRPWMKCAEIADYVCGAVKSGNYDFIRLNFPNGDMVGHTGVYEAVVCGLEAMDIQIGRIAKAVEAAGGILLITADHGNAEDMFEHDKKTGAVKTGADGEPMPKTSHTTNLVPFILADTAHQGEYNNSLGGLKEGLGITSIAATCVTLLGFVPPEDWTPPILTLNGSSGIPSALQAGSTPSS